MAFDLDCIILKIPDKDSTGKNTVYFDTSIQSILDSQDPYDMFYLEEWIKEQILHHLGWRTGRRVTCKMIQQTLRLFDKLSIKPTGCTYEPKGETNDSN